MNLATPSLSPDAVQLLNWMASYKDAGTTPGAQLHGPGGLLATPGMNRQVMNAMIMPRGLAGRLPVRASIDTNEIFGILTGVLASTGDEPTADCAAWPTVGQFKICRQQFPFGQQGRQSPVLNVKHAGEIVNRGEFRDNVLFGRPAMDPAAGAMAAPVNWSQVLQQEVEKKFGELYLGYYRDYARRLYTGDPLNTGTAGSIQYRGLDLQIQTGKRDAITGVLCPAADSLVTDLGSVNVNANNGANGGIVYGIIANDITNLDRLAEQLGLEVKWAIVGRYGAFWSMTNIWSCVYATTGCAVNTVVHTVNLEEATRMRDAMRKGHYLYVEGKEVEFIIDDSIAEEVAAGGVVGTYESDLYYVPLTANGEPMTFWEYFPMNGEAISAANRMAPGGFFDTLDGGRFLLVRQSPTHTCVQVEIIERPRVVLAAPFLAARWLNMRYTISRHERDAFPDDEYFVNGGSPTTPLPYFYPNATGG